MPIVVAALVAAGCGLLKPSASETPTPVTKAASSPIKAPPPPAVSEPVSPRNPENLTAAGLAAYENGNYPLAEVKLRAALESAGSTADQITAHKLLAFIACASKKRNVCESHFRQALSLDREFTLSAAEAGHPAWGPVFNRIKAETINKAAASKK